MPLARMAMYSKGVDIYLAPTADARDSWQATLRHIACEGRCFVLGCNQFVTKSMYPADLDGIEDLVDQPEIMCRGGSAIISPLGDVIAGPLYNKEGILYADLDLAEVARSKFDFDVMGHYARPDVFQLMVWTGSLDVSAIWETEHPHPNIPKVGGAAPDHYCPSALLIASAIARRNIGASGAICGLW